MKKLLLTGAFVLVSTSAMAQYFMGYGPVSGGLYYMPEPAPVIVEQPVVVQKQIIQRQVVIQSRPVCTSYPDPWDTLGYIFGDPIMITVCQ